MNYFRFIRCSFNANNLYTTICAYQLFNQSLLLTAVVVSFPVQILIYPCSFALNISVFIHTLTNTSICTSTGNLIRFPFPFKIRRMYFGAAIARLQPIL